MNKPADLVWSLKQPPWKQHQASPGQDKQEETVWVGNQKYKKKKDSYSVYEQSNQAAAQEWFTNKHTTNS